jgi:hypothetical protein
MIKVTYDGEYPNACTGTLTIIVDGETIYSKEHCCSSTGSCGFDDSFNEFVTDGRLDWDDEGKFSREIVEAVYQELDKIHVCCGGCL